MKFEEVLPALREGRKITNSAIKNSGYQYIYYNSNSGTVFDDKGGFYHLTFREIVDSDNWEIVKEKKKVKLRDLTEEQFKSYCNRLKENGSNKPNCHKCMFKNIGCEYWHPSCWVKHKDLYSDKFLDQEIEIEEE